MLSTRLTTRLRPQSILQLPLEARAIAYRQSLRPFHASAPVASNVPDLPPASQEALHAMHGAINHAFTLPHTMLETLHATGLPWAAVLPLSALLVRGLFLFPVLNVPARMAQQRRLNLNPLVQAWAFPIRNKVMYENRLKGPDWCDHQVKKLRAEELVKLELEFKCRWWRRGLPLLQLPVFVTLAETIRMMVGANASLFGMIADKISPKAAAYADRNLEQVLADVKSSWLEPSMAKEGALWFPDLTAADPTLTLPFLVSAVTFTHIYRSSRPEGQQMRVAQIVLRRALLILALAIGPLTLKVPSAIMIYWLSSTLCTMASTALLDKWLPLKAPPKACRRPLSA